MTKLTTVVVQVLLLVQLLAARDTNNNSNSSSSSIRLRFLSVSALVHKKSTNVNPQQVASAVSADDNGNYANNENSRAHYADRNDSYDISINSEIVTVSSNRNNTESIEDTTSSGSASGAILAAIELATIEQLAPTTTAPLGAILPLGEHAAHGQDAALDYWSADEASQVEKIVYIEEIPSGESGESPSSMLRWLSTSGSDIEGVEAASSSASNVDSNVPSKISQKFPNVPIAVLGVNQNIITEAENNSGTNTTSPLVQKVTDQLAALIAEKGGTWIVLAGLPALTGTFSSSGDGVPQMGKIREEQGLIAEISSLTRENLISDESFKSKVSKLPAIWFFAVVMAGAGLTGRVVGYYDDIQDAAATASNNDLNRYVLSPDKTFLHERDYKSYLSMAFGKGAKFKQNDRATKFDVMLALGVVKSIIMYVLVHNERVPSSTVIAFPAWSPFHNMYYGTFVGTAKKTGRNPEDAASCIGRFEDDVQNTASKIVESATDDVGDNRGRWCRNEAVEDCTLALPAYQPGSSEHFSALLDSDFSYDIDLLQLKQDWQTYGIRDVYHGEVQNGKVQNGELVEAKFKLDGTQGIRMTTGAGRHSLFLPSVAPMFYHDGDDMNNSFVKYMEHLSVKPGGNKDDWRDSRTQLDVFRSMNFKFVNGGEFKSAGCNVDQATKFFHFEKPETSGVVQHSSSYMELRNNTASAVPAGPLLHRSATGGNNRSVTGKSWSKQHTADGAIALDDFN